MGLTGSYGLSGLSPSHFRGMIPSASIIPSTGRGKLMARAYVWILYQNLSDETETTLGKPQSVWPTAGFEAACLPGSNPRSSKIYVTNTCVY